MLKRNIRLIATFVFLVSLFILFEITGIRQNINLDYIQNIFQTHWLTGSMIFILLFSIGNLVQLPGWLFLAAAVLTLGKTYGGLITYLAAVSSCCITFGLVFMLGGDALRKLESPLAKRLLSRLDEYPLKTIILLRSIFQTAPPLNFTLAVSGVPFRQYLLGTLLGLPLPITVYCLFFGSIKDFLI